MSASNLNIAVFGMGYVGCVSAACFAESGHSVVGVDPQALKVDAVNAGRSPLIETGLTEMIQRNVAEGRLKATTHAADAVRASDITIVCVGTPSLTNGNLDLSSVFHACEEIGAALRHKDAFHLVVIRSTVLPGTVLRHVVPALERTSGKRVGDEIAIAHNPEFMREGTAIRDFYAPPKTVIGGSDERAVALLRRLYANVDGPVIEVPIEVSEMVKYTDNAWHALKVAFSNEIGNVCKETGIDSYEVMNVFCQDTKLNISTTYLRPGFAFGGSCLPKDVRALTYWGRSLDLELPVLDSIMRSNRTQVERAIARILSREKRRIGFLGCSFKAGTDDLRESPLVELIERLIGKGCDIRLYDRNVNLSRLVGANRDYILRVIPHIAELMVPTLDAALDHGEIIVIGNEDPEFRHVPDRLRRDQILVEMTRLSDGALLEERYDGINW